MLFRSATEGTFWEDEYFDGNWSEAKRNSIVRGAYHFFQPKKNVARQLTNFTSIVQLEKGDLPPVIDIEDAQNLSKKEVVVAVKLFAEGLEKKYGVKPIIYSNRSFIKNYLADDFQNYTFWIAHYFKPELTINDIRWAFWQHSDHATLLQSGTKVDADVFDGDLISLEKMTVQ